MIRQIGKSFVLDTEHTTYGFRVLETGHLEHLYYGRKIRLDEASLEAIGEKRIFPPGNTCLYRADHPELSLEGICLEMSAHGKGDIREPFLEVVHADGSVTSDFLYEKAKITAGKEEFRTLPGSYGKEDEVEHLCVTLKDSAYGLTLELHYYVYAACDVITRSAKLVNHSQATVKLERIMSLQLDLDQSDYVFTTFHGAWVREVNRNDVLVSAGKYVNESCTGTSSSRANPFVMLSRKETTEDTGECYGFNLIYSGNHYEAVEADNYGRTRFCCGIHPRSFCFTIAPEEAFEAPEAVMTYACEGFGGMSRQMHRFVREHIVRGEWKHKTRPVLMNSWEAAYFDINERKLVNLAKAGKEAGVELFVVDDGWFGTRNDDTQSLGDWTENEKKLPGGLKRLGERIRALGMDFGIWVEPEMVNVKSHLYEEHPDYAIQIPGKDHSEGRNQRILDLTRTDVQDYVIEEMSRVFASAEISYVKWDMNRIFTDYYSSVLPVDRQQEVSHRYVMGLYRCMKELTERFPHILFEGCASGGNRFDLGILCYFPQIWASDNTDAYCRTQIQLGYSYGYPMSVVSAHVSGVPNHQTLRRTPLETRFHVAAFGICGYECNFSDMKKEDLEAVKEQISLYKQWRDVLQWGDFYRISEGDQIRWMTVSKDQRKAVGFFMQTLARPNASRAVFRAKGLDPERIYHFYGRERQYDIRDFGDLINTIAPVHIRQDSLLHQAAAKFVKLPGETEDHVLGGDALMYAGVQLAPAFCGTGYREGMRVSKDFDSSMYFMEAKEASATV